MPSRRYYDPEFYAMECELLWPHVWQMACRLAEIPNPGDFVEYQILDKSIIVVRQDHSTVRAYHNACRHRGVQLVKDRGTPRRGFTCPFHGWCYGLNGDNTYIYQPDLFDRSNIEPSELALTPCRVEIANGCAFINLDNHAPGLRESIEPFASTFDAWKAESAVARVALVLPHAGQLEAGHGSVHGGLPRTRDAPPALRPDKCR